MVHNNYHPLQMSRIWHRTSIDRHFKWYILVYTMLEKIVKKLTDAGIQFAVCGGYAVVLHGLPRTTIDLDIVIQFTEEQLVRLEHAMKELGFVSRIPVTAQDIYNFRHEYIKNRKVVAWSFYNEMLPIEVLDVLITCSVEEFDVTRKKVRGLSIPVLSLDSLIRLKSNTGRKQDQADVEALTYKQTQGKK